MTNAKITMSDAIELVRESPTINIATTAVLFDTGMYSIRKGVADGSIPCIRLGRNIRIPSSWVREQLHITSEAND